MRIRLAFCNELQFYSKIYSELDRFYQEKTGNTLDIAPKYYAGSIEEMREIIVMKNIKVEGFLSREFKEIFDRNHILTVFKTYAKLHATSFAFKDQKKEVYECITKDISDVYYDFGKNNTGLFSLHSCLGNLEKIFGNSESNRKILDKIKHLSGNMEQVMTNIKRYDTNYTTVTHGDCNCNNLMFRNKDGDLKLFLIDFQAIRVGLPMTDLTYFFYTSCTSEEHLSQLDYYLDEYYKVLSSTIKELGSNPDVLYPKSVMKEHWKICSRYGAAIAVPVIKLSLHQGVQVNILEHIDNPPNEEEALANDLFDTEEFAKRITVLFQHLIDNDFI